jgi:hypothetical protein
MKHYNPSLSGFWLGFTILVFSFRAVLGEPGHYFEAASSVLLPTKLRPFEYYVKLTAYSRPSSTASSYVIAINFWTSFAMNVDEVVMTLPLA